MRLCIDVTRAQGRHLEGSVSASGGVAPVAFWGIAELIGILEAFLDGGSGTRPRAEAPGVEAGPGRPPGVAPAPRPDPSGAPQGLGVRGESHSA